MQEKIVFKKLLICISACVIAGLAMVGILVYLVDPFYHYHEPWFDIPVIMETAVYQTAGAAKNLDYDSVIVGTSMTENMHTSWYDEEMGWKTMKLSYSGARSKDLKAIFKEIGENECDLCNVVMDINGYQLTCESETCYVVQPEYLYDEVHYNDYKYMLNRDVIGTSLDRIICGMQGVKDNIDEAYTWEEPELFGEEIAKNTFYLRGSLIEERYQKYGEEGIYCTTGEKVEDFDERIRVCQENLDNITPFFEENPNTEFYVFFPPYSIIYWEEKVLNGELETILGIYEYAISELLKYDNVKVFYFQDEKDIISDLDNYRDSCHHKPEYNRYIFECIRDGEKMVTADNYKETIEEMYNYVKDFDYIALWTEEE